MSDSSELNLSGSSSAYENRVPKGLKFFYAIGAASESMLSVAFNAFNFFFYTNILGIPGTLAGLAITIALIFDAITDPLVGAVSDRWTAKLGRRHPFMLAAPLPVMLTLFMIYSPPETFGDFGLFMWLTVLTILMRSSMTLFHVPHLALGAELSADFTERTRVMSLNTLMQAMGAYGFGYFAYSYFFKSTPEFENGMLNSAAYVDLAITAALLGGAIMLLSTVATMSVIPRLSQVAANLPKFSMKEFFLDCRSALNNRNYLMLLLGYLLLSATLGTRETLGIHVNTYYWELVPSEIRYFTLVGMVAPVIGFFVTAPLHERFEKKPVLIFGLVGTLVCSAAPVTLRILGLMPENHSQELLPVLMVFYLATITFGVILLISAMSALADITDEQELTTGRRQEGTFYAARSFFGKASSGLGHLFAGIAIDIIAFPVSAEPGSVDADTIFKLGLIDGPVAIIPAVIAIYFYRKYDLSRKRHSEIQAQLAAKA